MIFHGNDRRLADWWLFFRERPCLFLTINHQIIMYEPNKHDTLKLLLSVLIQCRGWLADIKTTLFQYIRLAWNPLIFIFLVLKQLYIITDM